MQLNGNDVNDAHAGIQSPIDRENALLAAIVESSEDAIVSNSLDQRITTWNKGAERMFGFTAEEAIGRPASLYMPPDMRVWDEKFLNDFETRLDQVHTFEVPCMRKDGSPVDVWTVCGGIRDREGKLVGISAIHRDVTGFKRAERELALLAALVKTSEDAIISYSTDFRITSWNRGAQRLLGYTAEDALGKMPFELYIPEGDRATDRARLTKDLAVIRENREAMRKFEGPLLKKDCTLLDGLIVGCGIYDSNGKLIGLSTIIRDVSERRRAESKRMQLATIVGASSDAIIGYSKELVITSWNPAAERLYGSSAEEAIGRGFDLFVSADQLPQALGACRRVLETGVPITFEQAFERKDGSTCTSLVNVFPIRDLEGNIVSGAGIGRDITERKRVERELATLAAIVNASQDAIIDVSLEARIATWNPAAEKTYGYTAEEAIGKGIDLFVPPEELEVTAARTQRVIETAEPVSWERHAGKKDGTSFVYAVNLFPILDLSGRIISVAGIERDITALKETERQLVAAREAAFAASQAKSEFLSIMSHEIRTPMTAILGMAELLAEGELNIEQHRYIEILNNNGHALLDLINSILDLAKIESGRLTLEHIAFDLAEVVEKSAQTLAIRAHAKGLELIVNIAPEVPVALLGDPLRLRQVLINLIGNAIKFTEHGEVAVSVGRECAPGNPLRLKFSVRDTGVGIAKEKLPALFATFSQADSSTARKYGGSGLGLAIVQRLVTLMQGEVTMRSELGKGSVFSFTAPFEPRLVSPAAALWPDLDKIPVLIVDDNQTAREVLRKTFIDHAARATEAASYAAATAEISNAVSAGQPPRIVLLDDRITGHDPGELTQLITAASRCGASIVAMIHCDNLAADISRLRSLKLESYLVKPINMRELAKLMRHVIVGNSSERPKEQRRLAKDAGPPLPVDRPLKILFADDSIDNRTLVRAFLKKTLYHLDEVENGRQAIDSVIAGKYDLVLMDIQMPEVDGYAATRAIRDWEREHNRARTPIIALTASVFSDAVRLTRAAGCDAHVGKPVSKAALLRAVYDAIEAAQKPAPELSTGPG
jgi:PAS domain S-box-containing protein